MRKALIVLLAVGLSVAAALLVETDRAEAGQRRLRVCSVPLEWGEVKGLSVLGAEVRQYPVQRFGVLFEADDGTLRVVSSAGCHPVAVMRRQ
jgi:hypothetical protein